MKYANQTHKRILDRIHDEVVRFLHDSSGKESAYEEGWEDAMRTAEAIINNSFQSQENEDGAEEETHESD